MRAVVLEAYNEPFQLRDLPEPTPGPGEVAVAVKACGVCGSDLFLQKGGFGSVLPMVPGHEAAGQVIAVGEGVVDVAPGDRVAIYYILHCGRCRFCLTGRPNVCRHVQRIGIDRFGAMAERIVVPARNVLPIPDGVDDLAAAVITDAIGTPLHALRVAQVQPGETVLVVGIGGIGSGAIQLAKRMGAQVIAASRSEANRRLAEAMGADAVLPFGDDLGRRVRDLTDGLGADVVLQCAPGAAAYQVALTTLANTGRLILVGSAKDPISVRVMEDLVWREAQVRGSRGFTPEDIRMGFDWYSKGWIRVDHLTRVVLPLEEINQAIANLSDPNVVRSIVVP